MLLRFLLVSAGTFLGMAIGLLGYIVWAILSIPYVGIHTGTSDVAINTTLSCGLIGALIVGSITRTREN